MWDIESLLLTGETQSVEFKTSFSNQDNIIDSLVAFANAQGGLVVVGVSPETDHQVVGANIGNNTLERFAVRLRERAGALPAFRSDTVEYRRKRLVVFSVEAHHPGQLLLAAGCAWIRVASTNQRMNAGQIRNRILEDPELAVGRPRFQVTGGSSTNPKDGPHMTLVRTIEQVQGDVLESIEVRYVGPLVNPPMSWQRSRVEREPRRSAAQVSHQFLKSAAPLAGCTVPEGHLAIKVRFRWHGTNWYELHLFPFSDWNTGGEILPSRMRRNDTEWIEAS